MEKIQSEGQIDLARMKPAQRRASRVCAKADACSSRRTFSKIHLRPIQRAGRTFFAYGSRETVMKHALACSLVVLLLVGPPLYAEGLCVKCLVAAQKDLKKCLDAAISKEDKTSCLKKQDVRSKSCEDGECKIEKAVEAGNKSEGSQAINAEGR